MLLDNQTAVITHLSAAGEAAIRVMANNNKAIIPRQQLCWLNNTRCWLQHHRWLLRFVVFSSLFYISIECMFESECSDITTCLA